MKNKIINFIFYIFAFYFVIFTIIALYTECFELSEFLLKKFNINIPPFGFMILGIISFGCLVTTFIMEKEKKDGRDI